MSSENAILLDQFERLLADYVTPAQVRAIEAGSDYAGLWSSLCETGFLDALVPDADGGAGLGLPDGYALIAALGAQAVPVPFAETMIARWILAKGGMQAPADAAIILAAPSAILPHARIATHAMVQDGQAISLVEATPEGDDPFRLTGSKSISMGQEIASFQAEEDSLRFAAAAVTAACMAGAMARMLDMTLSYASERNQFGRPLGKFQAIQQQIAVMAEEVISAQVAARAAFSGKVFDEGRVAVAKARANEAATAANAIAHAVHAAIGVTEEFDLQLYSRRLKQWQLAYGSEDYWSARLGRLRAGSGCETTADFIRDHLAG